MAGLWRDDAVATPHVVVTLESIDVIHSFHVPQFGWMQDAVPGKTNYSWQAAGPGALGEQGRRLLQSAANTADRRCLWLCDTHTPLSAVGR